jgi:hypothetical protein
MIDHYIFPEPKTKWHNDVGFDMIEVDGKSRLLDAKSTGDGIEVPGAIDLTMNRADPDPRIEHLCTACDRVMEVTEGDDSLKMDPAFPGGRWRETRVRCPGCGLDARFRWCA